MKIGRAEFSEDVHVPGLRVRRPVQLTAGEHERLAQPSGSPAPAKLQATVEMALGEHTAHGIPENWLVITVDGEMSTLIPESKIAALYPPEKPKAEARPAPAQQGAKK